MVFSSWIVAPRAASSLVSVCFSSRVTGGMGAGRRAEPPPAETTKALGRGDGWHWDFPTWGAGRQCSLRNVGARKTG